jgi:hypothetical protein
VFKECVEVGGNMIPALPCRSDCERRKAKWDGCMAEIEKDADVKANFDAQMLAVMDNIALVSVAVWGHFLPMGSDGKRSPFQFLECDAVGGDVDKIADADSALAFIHGQVPYISPKSPSAIISACKYASAGFVPHGIFDVRVSDRNFR